MAGEIANCHPDLGPPDAIALPITLDSPQLAPTARGPCYFTFVAGRTRLPRRSGRGSLRRSSARIERPPPTTQRAHAVRGPSGVDWHGGHRPSGRDGTSSRAARG